MERNGYSPGIFDDSTCTEHKQSVFKSIILPKGHQSSPSVEDAYTQRGLFKSKQPSPQPLPAVSPLGERQPNRDGLGRPTRMPTAAEEDNHGLQKKDRKRTVSADLPKDLVESGKPLDDTDESGNGKPKKSKSSTGLSALLKLPQRSRKGSTPGKDTIGKENRSPIDHDSVLSMSPGPRERPLRNNTPDKRRTLAEEISLYSPREYSPGKQRNFHGPYPPALAKRVDPAPPRPKSDLISGSGIVGGHLSSPRPNLVEPVVCSSRPGLGGKPSQSDSRSGVEKKKTANTKGPSRVQAAISAFNAKDKEAEPRKKTPDRNVEGEFERLLVCTNRSLYASSTDHL